MPLFINKGTPINPIRYNVKSNPGTEVYFGLMLPGGEFKDAIIKKKYTSEDTNCNGDVIINFAPEDTMYLDDGKYYYMIKVALPDGTINTVIEKTEFWLM